MATDLSKYLYYSREEGTTKPEIEKVASFKCIEAFIEELVKRQLGASGMISKLNTLMSAQCFSGKQQKYTSCSEGFLICTECLISQEDMALESKINVCKSKSAALNKGLTKEKNGRAARKREYMAQTLQPPEDLIQFLQADETWQRLNKTFMQAFTFEAILLPLQGFVQQRNITNSYI